MINELAKILQLVANHPVLLLPILGLFTYKILRVSFAEASFDEFKKALITIGIELAFVGYSAHIAVLYDNESGFMKLFSGGDVGPAFAGVIVLQVYLGLTIVSMLFLKKCRQYSDIRIKEKVVRRRPGADNITEGEINAMDLILSEKFRFQWLKFRGLVMPWLATIILGATCLLLVAQYA